MKANGRKVQGAAENSAAERPRGRPFPPGQSGNPGGRPKAVRELLELARSQVPGSLELAVKLRDDEKQDARVRLDAAKFLVSYGLGAPPKAAADPDGDDGDASALDGLTPEEIQKLARLHLTETGH